MTNYNFNGLTNTLLPNVFINKITLDGADAALNKIAANRESVIEMHIDKRTMENTQTDITIPDMFIFDDEGNLTPKTIKDFAGWQGNLGSGEFVNASKLSITYDLFLEVEEMFDDLEMFVDNIFKYIEVHILTFKNLRGKEAYKFFIEDAPAVSFQYALDYVKNPGNNSLPVAIPGNSMQLTPDNDYKYSRRVLGELVENLSTPASGQEDPAKQLSWASKSDIIKQKYRHILPDGKTIYKIPIRIKEEILGDVFPKDLSAIVVCTLNTDLLGDDFIESAGLASQSVKTNQGDAYYGFRHGRIATEVIVSGGKVPKKGMIFFISTNQETEMFDHLMGTLWLGGVHFLNSKGRFVAGNFHKSDVATPYLDYVLVNNNRVHDFRQLAYAKKQIINFNSNKNLIFGGNYIDNRQSKTVVADFSDLPCFSNLLSSVDTNKQIKLFFSIDWGKLLKKYSLAPGLLDILSDDFGAMKSFMKTFKIPSIISFKIYRKRIGKSNGLVNKVLDRKLIYDGFPNIFYNGKMGVNIPKTELNIENENNRPLISALTPINLISSSHHTGHFSFTDYDIEHVSKGIFEYSLEIEFHDPALAYYAWYYNAIKGGINELEAYVSLSKGNDSALGSSYGNKSLFNIYTGQFTQEFKAQAMKMFGIAAGDPFSDQVSNSLSRVKASIIGAIGVMRLFSSVAVNLEAAAEIQPDIETLMSLLNPDTATPDSIFIVYDLLSTVSNKLKSYIDSFSTAKIPKSESLEQVTKEKAMHKKPIASTIPKRKIKVEYTFSDPSELVNTAHFEAGYESFFDVKRRNQSSIGLKSMFIGDVEAKFKKERNKFLKIPDPGDVDVEPAEPTPSFILKLPSGEVAINVAMTPMTFQIPHYGTHLPKYIVDAATQNEHHYWMIVNNIIRYKMGLYGDTDSQHRLGYGPEDKLGGSKIIDSTMERILKEYQSLAHRGIFFPQSSVVDPSYATDLAASSKETQGESSEEEQEQTQIPWEGAPNNPLPPVATETFESQTNAGDSEDLLKLMQVPWPSNYGQEKLLLSLVNGTFLNISNLDVKLGSFDPNFPGTKLNNFIVDMEQTYGSELTNLFFKNQVPFQTLILIINNIPSTKWVVGGSAGSSPGQYAYFHHGGGLYTPPTPEDLKIPAESYVSNQNMKLDKFGSFWFDHMNIVELQYLSHHSKTQPPPPIKIEGANSVSADGNDFMVYPSVNQLGANTKIYENVYSENIKAPVWTSMSAGNLKALAKTINTAEGAQRHILCRVAKKRVPFFNSKPYEVLDLPLYDEYFLLTTEEQVDELGEWFNSYTHGVPGKETGPEAFKMKQFSITSQSQAPETKQIEELLLFEEESASSFEDDNE